MRMHMRMRMRMHRLLALGALRVSTLLPRAVYRVTPAAQVAEVAPNLKLTTDSRVCATYRAHHVDAAQARTVNTVRDEARCCVEPNSDSVADLTRACSLYLTVYDMSVCVRGV